MSGTLMSGAQTVLDVGAEGGFNCVVMLEAVEGVGNGASAGLTHGADKTVTARDIPFFG